MSDPQHVVTWAQVAAGVGAGLAFAFIISLMIPIPWVLLAAWLESRHEIKRTLAQARLQEAKNAARQQERKP